MVSKKKLSAGILMYRINKMPEVLLAHPGGPYWVKKDNGAWSIPKGEFAEGDDPLQNAVREFKEETGQDVDGKFIPLTPLKQKNGKLVYAWMVKGDFNLEKFSCNFFEMEWPPRSGKMVKFPEVDKVMWFSLEEANNKILEGQRPFITELINILSIK